MGPDRDEIEAAFIHYWRTGPVGENWVEWVRCFTPDVTYVDHFWGPLRGRAEVAAWIDPVMMGVPEIYTVLDWYAIEGDKVIFRCENRRDNPHSEGPEYFDFPGLSVLWYGGDGLWRAEEDYWDRDGARRTSIEYADACRRAGVTTWEERMTRNHWPASPEWAALDTPPNPSWVGRTDLAGITKPRELAAVLAPLRDGGAR